MIDEHDEHYRQIGLELGAGKVDPGLMARAIAESEGDQGAAISIYTRYRLGVLISEVERERKRKDQEAEAAEVAALRARDKAELEPRLLRVEQLGLSSWLTEFLEARGLGVDSADLQQLIGSVGPGSLYEWAQRLHRARETDQAHDLYRIISVLFPRSDAGRYAVREMKGIELHRPRG
ncbi:hypothetical protein N9L90_01095 [Planctomycetota bacterium]|nr:hypothetical protein [Planctomycetota bacterium]